MGLCIAKFRSTDTDSSPKGLYQLEGLVPERVCWFKSSPQQSKSLRCNDLPGGTENGPP